MRIIKNKNITKLNTFGIKCVADYFCKPKSEEDVLFAIDWARKNKKEWNVIGGGSNIVCAERVRGLIIHLSNGVIKQKNNVFVVDAGVPLADLVSETTKKGYKGLETLSGIPGTVGGAVIGNAGAYGTSIHKTLSRVFVITEDKTQWIENKDCEFGYRESKFKTKKVVIFRAEFILDKGNKKELIEKSRTIIETRNKKYMPGIRCPGSYFKNIHISEIPKQAYKKIDQSKIIDSKLPAGYILELVFAKGIKKGDMMVSEFHANCIVNKKNGTAKEAKTIARILKKRILKAFGIIIKEEVRYL